MGSSSSKTSSSSSSSSRSSSSRARRAIQSACFCSTLHGSDHTESEYKKKVTLRKTPSGVQTRTNTDDIKIECCAESNDVKSDELPCLSPSVQPDQWGQGSISDIDSRTNGQSIQVCSSRPSNSLNSFLSRVTSIPRNISFRLNRTASLGSSRSFPASSAHLRVLSDEEEFNLHTRQGRGCVNGGLSTQMISSDHPVVRDTNSLTLVVDGDSHPPRTQSQMEPTETRQLWWTGARDHNEQNFRFGRTLSVGRLRDRVLRRSSLSDLVFSPPQQETDIRGSGQDSGRHIWHGDVVPPAPEVNVVSSSFSPVYASSSLPNSLVSTQDYQMETAQSTESRYNDLLEDRSNFLERRRRIRSQVRALRRLGSRFENLSGHTRSCIMSGEVRTGRCACRIRSHDTSTNNDSNTGSSISRIVMLAEALFEVLDEIHQQSVVLSSQPSISSIGSVPAPNEVVESLPLKSYSKLQKQKIDEDTSQCYICLLDYEEGDSLRSLPCQHEFHRACVDKWLKEIHRVCPLCRGDVCRTNSLPLEM